MPFLRASITSESAIAGSVYLALMVLFNSLEWKMGGYRSLLLVMMLAFTFTAFLISHTDIQVGCTRRRSGYSPSPRSPSANLTFGCIVVLALVPIVDAVLSLGGRYHVRVLGDAIISIVILASGLDARPRRRAPTMLMPTVLLIALLLPLSNFVSGLIVPKLEDIATTTVTAATALWSGRNPYAMYIDILGAASVHNLAFGGYKYLPLMILTYAPFVATLGKHGILWANILFYSGTLVAVFALARRLSTTWCGFPVLLFVSSFILSADALAMGTNDIAALLPILGAFLLWPNRPGLVGLLIGVSLCMKPFPGIVAATLLVPSQRKDRSPYMAGIVIALLPALVFFLWAPRQFTNNIILFNLVRPVDPTTWRYGTPNFLGALAAMTGLGVWMGLTLWCLRVRAELRSRLYAFVIVVICVLLAGPTDRDNYAMWWAPILAVLISTFDFRRTAARVRNSGNLDADERRLRGCGNHGSSPTRLQKNAMLSGRVHSGQSEALPATGNESGA
ncbi:MAG TPA: glycosyltransferase family 87 protein [Stellaceae bacterium]|nr:glycosyltransferase family 87 protein [Stellaceae bacterium]